MNILVCTLGASWAVIPEVLGFVAPDIVDLYRRSEQFPALIQVRRTHQIEGVDELWICTTEGTQTAHALAQLREWWRSLGNPIPLRVWTALGTDQLASQQECTLIRELLFRVVLDASERTRPGHPVVSLAGGRKTMSADMQSAGGVFGARACLHVVGPDPLPAALRDAPPELFTRPLPSDLVDAVRPLVVGAYQRSELLDISVDGQRVVAERYPVPMPAPDGTPLRWAPPPEAEMLTDEIEHRARDGNRLLGNYLASLAESDRRPSWRSLYRLPPGFIDVLRRTRLSERHGAWLRALPKADLHRHLGGCLTLDQQRAVGHDVWAALSPVSREAAMHVVSPLLRSRGDWQWDWPEQLKHAKVERAACAAALLVHADDAALHRNLWGVTEPRVALRASPYGFAAYERPGELSGSALLGHPAAIEPYARALVDQARAEGLSYVEIRGSPHKYRPEDPGGFLEDLRGAIVRAAGSGRRASVVAGVAGHCGEDSRCVPGASLEPQFGFVWILDRRQRAQIAHVIGQAVQARRTLSDFLYGLDLAGDEGTTRPEELAPHFIQAFRECLRITIHAGEGESVQNIWEAAYHLHADRIGHGLTLLDSDVLTERFRDRGTCIELCPVSNREVVGFRDPASATHSPLPVYPLRGLLDAGLPVVLCTDNPGISRTTLANEFLVAARMTEGGLTLWEALSMMYTAHEFAFTPASIRQRILSEADAALFRHLTSMSGITSLRDAPPSEARARIEVEAASSGLPNFDDALGEQ